MRLLHVDDDGSNGGSSFCGVSWLLNCWAAMCGGFGLLDHLYAVRGVCWWRFAAWGGLVVVVEVWLPIAAETAMVVVFFLVLWLVAADS
jgi:hypothetical protein